MTNCRRQPLRRDERGVTTVELLIVLFVLVAGVAAAFPVVKQALESRSDLTKQVIITGNGGDMSGAEHAGGGGTGGATSQGSAPTPAPEKPSLWDRYVAFMRSDAIPAGEDSPWLREFALGALQGDFNDLDKNYGPGEQHLRDAAIAGETLAGLVPVTDVMSGVRDGIYQSVEYLAAENQEQKDRARAELLIEIYGLIPFDQVAGLGGKARPPPARP
jgi:hypothetical protein